MKPKIVVDDVERANWARKTEITPQTLDRYIEHGRAHGWQYQDRTAWARHKERRKREKLFDDE